MELKLVSAVAGFVGGWRELVSVGVQHSAEPAEDSEVAGCRSVSFT